LSMCGQDLPGGHFQANEWAEAVQVFEQSSTNNHLHCVKLGYR
jgi:hypothetical protein